MINLGVITLLRHPDQLDKVMQDASLWPSAVAEICRYHTASAYALRRVALQDVHVGGQTIKSGELPAAAAAAAAMISYFIICTQ
jgi:nitric oxide reductase